MPGCINGLADRKTDDRSSDKKQGFVAGTLAHRRESGYYYGKAQEIVPIIRHGKEENFYGTSRDISQILAILEDVAEVSPEDVNENSVLMDDLDLSSMEILTIVADLEETFGLRIPEKELRNFVTIGDLVDYLAANAG